MKMDDQMIDRLKTTGWVELNNVKSDDDIILISQGIGKIVPHSNGHSIFRLRPNDGRSATKGSYSNKYGFGSFPLHTDTAFWTIPVRYILFFSNDISTCPTLIVSADKIMAKVDRKHVERAIFRIKTPQKQFYSSLIFRENDADGIKYDSTCMFPANQSAKTFVETLSKTKLETYSINWSGHKAVIIDNWKIFHGRGGASSTEFRELSRIYINKTI